MKRPGGLSISGMGLNQKLMVSFSLMTVIPLLACVYLLSPCLRPEFRDVTLISVTVFVSVALSILGLIIAKGIIRSVIEIASDTKRIADGDYERRIDLKCDDELDGLGESINTITNRIKSSIDELRGYSQDMKEINGQIQKKVTSLSSLLQIDDAISAGSMQLEQLLEFVLKRAADINDNGFGALYMPRVDNGDYILKLSCGLEDEKLSEIVVKRIGSGLLEAAIDDKKIVYSDCRAKAPKDLDGFKKRYSLKNFIVIPLYSNRSAFGLMILGNRQDDFVYSSDDIDLATIFAKHATIAIESDVLTRRNRELSTRDELTGLFNKNYVLARLEEEIKRSIFYQRPCSFVIFRIDNFREFREANGELAAEEALRRVAKLIRDNNVPVGRAARIGGSEFAMLLPEKNKKQASNISEDIRRKIASAYLTADNGPVFTVACGVSENPIDGTTADELFGKCMLSIRR